MERERLAAVAGASSTRERARRSSVQWLSALGATPRLQRISAFAKLGVDTEKFAHGLLEYCKGWASDDESFGSLPQVSFAAFLRGAYPDYAPQADAIFGILDAQGRGEVGFDDFLGLLLSDSVTANPEFMPVTWTQSEYGVGQAGVDSDHRKLFTLIDNITEATMSGRGDEVDAALRGLRESYCSGERVTKLW